MIDPEGSHVLIDADPLRVLELTPFAFAALLANQSQGVPGGGDPGEGRYLGVSDVGGSTKGNRSHTERLDRRGTYAGRFTGPESPGPIIHTAGPAFSRPANRSRR